MLQASHGPLSRKTSGPLRDTLVHRLGHDRVLVKELRGGERFELRGVGSGLVLDAGPGPREEDLNGWKHRRRLAL